MPPASASRQRSSVPPGRYLNRIYSLSLFTDYTRPVRRTRAVADAVLMNAVHTQNAQQEIPVVTVLVWKAGGGRP